MLIKYLNFILKPREKNEIKIINTNKTKVFVLQYNTQREHENITDVQKKNEAVRVHPKKKDARQIDINIMMFLFFVRVPYTIRTNTQS